MAISRNKKIWRTSVVTVWPLLAFQLFQYRAIPLVILKMTGFLSSFILFLLTIKDIYFKSYKAGSIPFYFKVIITLTILTFLIAWGVWNQPFPNTFRSSIVYFNLCFFFLLEKFDIEQKDLLRCIFIYTVIVILLWFYAIGQAPTIVFGSLGDDNSISLVNNRGNFRIDILGQRFSIICLFYLLGKAMTNKKRHIVYYLLAFGLFVFNCTDLTRSNIASIIVGVIAIFYMFNKNKLAFFIKVIMIFMIAGTLIWYLFGDQIEILSSLTDDQFTTGTTNDDGLYRLKEYIFFFTQFKSNPLTFLFGNGIPNSSSYQIYVNMMQDHGFYLDDVSYAYIFISLGLVGLITYIALICKLLSLRTTIEVAFAKAYIVYAAFANITVMALMDSIPLSVCAYLIYKNYLQSKEKRFQKL